MNKVILIGNLVNNAEIRVTKTNKTVANLTLAVNEGKDKEATFINCIAWEKTAELIQNYTTKGNKIAVEGKIQNRTWDKPDGTKGYATDIVILSVQFLTPKSGKAKALEPLPEVNVEDINVKMPF